MAHEASVRDSSLAHGDPSVAKVMATLFGEALSDDGCFDHAGGGVARAGRDNGDGREGSFDVAVYWVFGREEHVG